MTLSLENIISQRFTFNVFDCSRKKYDGQCFCLFKKLRNQSDACGNNVDRRAISNMHNYYYCTPERRGYWSPECYSRETCCGATGERTLQWLETAANYGSDHGVENGATLRSNATNLFLKRRLINQSTLNSKKSRLSGFFPLFQISVEVYPIEPQNIPPFSHFHVFSLTL